MKFWVSVSGTEQKWRGSRSEEGTLRFGVLVFPGTWSDRDCYHAVRDGLGEQADFLWHKDTAVDSFDCLILPGGFSYGDYLRVGAIARFSPVMKSVVEFAKAGRPVIGICNGFQILCEAGLLPGVLMKNSHLQFRCEWAHIRVENNRTPFTNQAKSGQVLAMPVSHGDGNYHVDAKTLASMEEAGQVVFRYCDEEGELSAQHNPNGSLSHIAGVTNPRGNVLGMMPHPERAADMLLGGNDGLVVMRSLVEFVNSAPLLRVE